MNRTEKLVEKARRNLAGFRFSELCYLIETYGYVLKRQTGSHRIYKRENHTRLVLQPNQNGMAKGYQVLQALEAIGEK